jgi:hemoglobin
MNKITDFWERNLLATGSFSGNPGRTHIQVDQHENNTLSASHFNRWLSLWYQTLDTMYKGPITEEAKEKATRIGSNFLRMIMLNRSQKLSGPGFFAPEFKQTARPESEADPSANSKPNTPPES